MNFAIELGEKRFSTKKSAEDFVRLQLANFDPQSSLWQKLLNRHPERESKVGCGIREFFVTPNRLKPKAIQLNIRRVDSSEVDISWKRCISGRPMAQEARLKVAMRQAIVDQIQSFKSEHYNGWGICSVCEIKETQRAEIHVDHFPRTFQELVEEFLIYSPTVPNEFADCPESHAAIFRKEDSSFAEQWSAFHQDRASLRILCQSCNLKRKKSK
jgi:hypothetical protein